MAEVRRLSVPFDAATAASLRVGDLVLLDGEIVVTAGLPTHDRILDHLERGLDLPIDLRGAAFFHLGSYSEEKEGVFDVLYMNPTTSTRFNRHMPRLIRGLGLHATGGKGGLDAACARAMQEAGCVYLSFLGGGCALLSEAIAGVVQVAWDDLVPHYRLVKLRVAGLGPLVVAIDAHGNNQYARLRAAADERLEAIMDELRERRGAAAGAS